MRPSRWSRWLTIRERRATTLWTTDEIGREPRRSEAFTASRWRLADAAETARSHPDRRPSPIRREARGARRSAAIKPAKLIRLPRRRPVGSVVDDLHQAPGLHPWQRRRRRHPSHRLLGEAIKAAHQAAVAATAGFARPSDHPADRPQLFLGDLFPHAGRRACSRWRRTSQASRRDEPAAITSAARA